jgi:hypothetical protein
MRTPNQIEASRINGAKSHGPITEEGKAASSRNAVKHGILAQTIVIEGESEERFKAHLNAFIDQYEPTDQHELALVEHMAVCRWRQLSVWGLETAGISNAIRELTQNQPELLEKEPAVRAFLAIAELGAKNNNLNLFQRYDGRFDRQFYRAYTKLMAKRKQ